MSSNTHQSKNKKQRRKNARVALQQTHPPDSEHAEVDLTQEILSTEQKHVETTDVVLKPETIQQLSLITDSPVEDKALAVVSKSEASSNGAVAAAVIVDNEKNDCMPNEEMLSSSPRPTPPTVRRRMKRNPIVSAIPLLPPIENSTGPPPKPAPGTLGTPTQVYVNHFPVSVAPNIILYQYDAVVEKPNFRSPNIWEEVPSRDHRRRFVEKLAKNNAFDFTYWYDEGKCFYSTTNISKRQFPLIYTLPPDQNENLRLCVLKLAGQWSTATITDYLRSPNSDVPASAVRILETLLKQALLPISHCEGSLFYRNEPKPDVSLPDGFELRLGFFQALCLTQAGLTLNLQTTLTKFYPYVDVLDFIEVHLNKDIRKYGMTINDYEKVKIALRGCKITTRQSNYTQIYQIRSFSDVPERQVFDFTKETHVNGQNLSSSIKYNLIEYYKYEKKIKLDYPKLRCLQCYFLHERHDPKHLPIELCRILQWQECERESASEQRNRQSHSIPTPEQRYRDIMSSLKSCQYRAPPTLPLCKAVQLSVDDKEMKLIKARILDPPVINNNNAEITMGRINLKGRFVAPFKITSITFVYFGPIVSPLPAPKKELMEKFVTSFNKMATAFRLGPIQTCTKDVVHIVENEENHDKNLAAINTCFSRREKQKCQLVVCIMDSSWNELRANIKQNGTVTYGIATQCLLYSKLQEQMDKFQRRPRGHPDRILDNMCENLLRKINFKLQGINTQVDLHIKTIASSGVASAKPKKEDAWQFMGADVIHPVCRQDKPSIAAVVGSGDSICSTSAVRVCKQWPKTGKCAIEAIIDLRQMVGELLEYYRGSNDDRLPNKIVFYRDGVDDGQFARVLNFEIPQIKEAFKDVYENQPLPLLTFIVVKKRHHTRFFIVNDRNETANISPGLVVDTDVVHPGQFSFFLNSHKALQGTNRPALYHVLYDEIKFTADELQLLTYYLCFTDPRSSTSEAIPSLIHQADLAASNARDLFPETDTSTTDGYAADALEEPTLIDVATEHLRVHENMRDTPHFG
ncbi:unnamed protein product [Rotaria socialis]|uniref:Uncharacterized protein n=1 Tax=Rotaria socialis TaxID=392032 RepID=A0A820TE57_9BILA|nr:unnamed protein product [Rotaria socialis]CAF3323042.1 unnamed protein product [Rotaria socialis]CAF3467763.1 unnamed protein product [Rotaria socialis]CAF3516441.1 unnamed protein product [Rotaria socialis]CAF4357913.1 unnamed protein product [Rotaria socialis]